jgi:hypothetical protein
MIGAPGGTGAKPGGSGATGWGATGCTAGGGAARGTSPEPGAGSLAVERDCALRRGRVGTAEGAAVGGGGAVVGGGGAGGALCVADCERGGAASR